MSLQHLPTDLKIHDRHGRSMVRSNIERGDTVTFVYENEKRTVLVLENDGVHLKGIAKERDGDYRNYLFRKITNIQYAKPFVKQKVAVSYELLPDSKPTIMKSVALRDIEFNNRQSDVLLLRVYTDGSSSLFKNGVRTQVFEANDPLNLLIAISNFLSE